MADIKLVIKIPEEEYRWIKKSDNSIFADIAEKECMLYAIKNGTPLPKGHGRLIDADELIKQYKLDEATKYGNKNAKQQAHSYSTMMLYEIADMIDDAPTIIEADKESKGYEMSECYKCGFFDSDYAACTCPSTDKWYACPIENKKSENIQALKDMLIKESEEKYDH